jgi:hypothetical protein
MLLHGKKNPPYPQNGCYNLKRSLTLFSKLWERVKSSQTLGGKNLIKIQLCEISNNSSLHSLCSCCSNWSVGHPWKACFTSVSHTVSRTPWTRDQPVARPLPTHKHRINANIHVLSGIRTHDPGVGAGADISCRRPRGHCDRLYSPLGPWPLLSSFMIMLQTVVLLGRVISSSQGIYSITEKKSSHRY